MPDVHTCAIAFYFLIQSTSISGAGVGIYPLGAMLNHSCTPNTMQSFSGSRIVFRAVQHIPAGAEATIAYVELAATRAERRAMLKANYFFDIDGHQVPLPQAPAQPLGSHQPHVDVWCKCLGLQSVLT